MRGHVQEPLLLSKLPVLISHPAGYVTRKIVLIGVACPYGQREVGRTPREQVMASLLIELVSQELWMDYGIGKFIG